MAKNFDVKINVIFPHITKSMPVKDSKRIQETTFFKYEPQKSIAQTEGSLSFEKIEEQTNEQKMDELNQELEGLKNDFKRLEDQSNKAFKNYAFSYDVNDVKNEALRTAEEAIFGTATGIITQDKYKKVLNLMSAIDELIMEKTIDNGGTLNVAS
jgi:hypothetical protein